MDCLRRALATLLSVLVIWTPACQTVQKGENDSAAAGSNVSTDKNTNNPEVPKNVQNMFSNATAMWKRLIEEEKWRVFVETDKGMQAVTSEQLEMTLKTTSSERVWFVSPDGASTKVIGIRSRVQKTTDDSQIFGLEGIDWKKGRKATVASQMVIVPARENLTDQQITEARLKVDSALKTFMKQVEDFGAGDTEGFGLKGGTAFKLLACTMLTVVFFAGLSNLFTTAGAAFGGGKSGYIIYFPLLVGAGVLGACIYLTYDTPLDPYLVK